jgi:glucose/arabinose dehydrogenase
MYVRPLMTTHLIVGLILSATATAGAQVPFSLTGPGVNPADFRLTEFASDLNYPVGMTELSDGSILVAVSNGSQFFNTSSGSLLRLADTDDDGIADVRQTLVDNVPGGKLTSLRLAGELLFVTGQGPNVPISVYRRGATVSDPPTLQGTMNISYAGSWLHPHSALAVRETPGVPGSYDLFFQLGSKSNFAHTTDTLPFTSTLGAGGNIAGDSIHMVHVTDDGTNVSTSAPIQVATGLRNPAGYAFHPVSGDLYFQDNGIDGLVDPNEPTSADELNVLPAADIGNTVLDYGFPDNYNEYRTGNVIGGEGVQPLVAFHPLPLPDGDESEGPNDVAFAPNKFPAGLNHGMFVGMHGRFNAGGLNNEENPLVFVDLGDNSYFHIIANDEPDVGHLDGLLSTNDSLFVADISPQGGFGGNAANSGKIYQIKSLVPEPSMATLTAWAAIGCLQLVRGRHAGHLAPIKRLKTKNRHGDDGNRSDA